MDANLFRTGLEHIVSTGLLKYPRIPELDFTPHGNYSIYTADEIIGEIIRRNQVIFVKGDGYGDEGKGQTIDIIANNPYIAALFRANSAQNAGHTLVLNGKKYFMHLIPSGIFVPGKECYIGNDCAGDPVTLWEEEIKVIKEAGIDYMNKLFIGNIFLIAPYHKLMDFIGNPTNSSTLQAVSPIHASKAKKQALRLNQLLNADEDFIVKR